MDLVVGGSGSTVKSLVSKLGSLLAQEYALIRVKRKPTSMPSTTVKRKPGTVKLEPGTVKLEPGVVVSRQKSRRNVTVAVRANRGAGGGHVPVGPGDRHEALLRHGPAGVEGEGIALVLHRQQHHRDRPRGRRRDPRRAGEGGADRHAAAARAQCV